MIGPPRLSVIVPVYNEGADIRKNLRQISEFLRTRYPDHELVAVDDGSSDNTRTVLNNVREDLPRLRVLGYPENRGKGAAVRTGMNAARGEWIAVVDADLELPIELLDGFFEVQRRTGARVVIGSKRHPDSRIHYPTLRRILSRGYGLGIRVLFDLPVRDTQVGFKLYHRSAVHRLAAHTLVKRFAFDLEILAIVARCDLSIAEAPVLLNFKRPGAGRIGLPAVINIARETAGIWYRLYVRRFYDDLIDSPVEERPALRLLGSD